MIGATENTQICRSSRLLTSRNGSLKRELGEKWLVPSGLKPASEAALAARLKPCPAQNGCSGRHGRNRALPKRVVLGGTSGYPKRLLLAARPKPCPTHTTSSCFQSCDAYSFNFRYRVVLPMPSMRAANSLSPLSWSMVRKMASFSRSAIGTIFPASAASGGIG